MRAYAYSKLTLSLVVCLGILMLCGSQPVLIGQTSPWKEAEEGLLVAEFDPPHRPANPSSTVTIIKIDPGKYSFRLLCASEYGKEKLTAKEWTDRYELIGAFNAGMFQEDGLTSVGYMKNFKHFNNPRLGKANTILAFNPIEDGVPEVQIIDRQCQDFSALKDKYQTFIQSIRMISCEGENVWAQQNSRWSTLAIGTDSAGNVLLIFSRMPYSVHDFIEILLSLPLSLKSAMYLEGGPQASLYLSTPKVSLERNGVWEGFEENNAFQFALPVPNVIGITRKAKIQTRDLS